MKSRSILWGTYEATVFCATVHGTVIHIRPGERTVSLDTVLEAHHVTSWAFITAWNPESQELPRYENDLRHAALTDDVRGFAYFEGEGQSTHAAWTPERSLLVLGLSVSEAVTIGHRYGQHAIVVGEYGHEALLVGCHGSKRPI